MVRGLLRDPATLPKLTAAAATHDEHAPAGSSAPTDG
jgi:hypothetical protein